MEAQLQESDDADKISACTSECLTIQVVPSIWPAASTAGQCVFGLYTGIISRRALLSYSNPHLRKFRY